VSASLDLPTFVARWQAARLTERSAAQSHFADLCRLLGQPTPTEADPTGDWYTFEKGAAKTTGGQGWADVWRRGAFAVEYKGRHKNLDAAYQQLLQYHESLENPPLLVVCDLDRVEVHTKFTGAVTRVYAFDLADLAANRPTATTHGLVPLEVLRALFTAPERLKPGRTTEQATEQAAAEFAKLAAGLHRRGADPEQAARFLMRLLFCLFAEDIGLLPAAGRRSSARPARPATPSCAPTIPRGDCAMRAPLSSAASTRLSSRNACASSCAAGSPSSSARREQSRVCASQRSTARPSTRAVCSFSRRSSNRPSA
jgi:hypothetical protein